LKIEVLIEEKKPQNLNKKALTFRMCDLILIEEKKPQNLKQDQYNCGK